MKYFDEVFCDVVPINFCSFLQGRPWQYGRQNYLWWKEEHLLSLQEELAIHFATSEGQDEFKPMV